MQDKTEEGECAVDQNIKVAIWGFGVMGRGITRTLLGKKGVAISGVCSRHPDSVGKGVLAMLDVQPDEAGQAEIIIDSDLDRVLAVGSCDICVLASDSFINKQFDKIVRVLEKRVNVITIAEEMAYPWAQEPELAAKLDEIAKRNGVSVLGTGINPGFVMDLLAICLSGCMTQVDSVLCERINSLSPFGATVMEEQGIGLAQEEFEAKSLAGHVGFHESVRMISDALGLGVNGFEQQMQPIVTDIDRKSPHGFAAAGMVAGVNMTAQGLRDGAVVVTMSHPQQIEPELAGVQTGDRIVLEGTPRVDMRIAPEISGGQGTIAMCVNCIPHVINAEPGLRTMLDIPVPHALMGDFRGYVRREKRIVKEAAT